MGGSTYSALQAEGTYQIRIPRKRGRITLRFNLDGLYRIYFEAIQRSEPTFVFEIEQGRGRFLFMMFFSKEDIDSRDRLFIFLRNTRTLLKLKLYGSHKRGDFFFYLEPRDQDAIIKELQLGYRGDPFNLENFLQNLNSRIPATLPLKEKIDSFKQAWPELKAEGMGSVIDEMEKTILIGVKRLPQEKRPREKTLRKLYLFADGNTEDIAKLINSLKSVNMTLAWTNDPSIVRKTVQELLLTINT